jgi:hypothetical protein
MKIVTEHYIETENLAALRTLISDIVTDIDLDVSDVFSWFKEDNTGDIQVDCSTWARGAVEEAIDIIKDNLECDEYNSEYTQDDVNLLIELFDEMVEASNNNISVLYIGE